MEMHRSERSKTEDHRGDRETNASS